MNGETWTVGVLGVLPLERCCYDSPVGLMLARGLIELQLRPSPTPTYEDGEFLFVEIRSDRRKLWHFCLQVCYFHQISIPWLFVQGHGQHEVFPIQKCLWGEDYALAWHLLWMMAMGRSIRRGWWSGRMTDSVEQAEVLPLPEGSRKGFLLKTDVRTTPWRSRLVDCSSNCFKQPAILLVL